MTVESINKFTWQILRFFYEIFSITSTRSITFILLRGHKTTFFYGLFSIPCKKLYKKISFEASVRRSKERFFVIILRAHFSPFLASYLLAYFTKYFRAIFREILNSYVW